MLALDPSEAGLFLQTDDDGTGDCASSGGSGEIWCGWNGTSWAPVGAGAGSTDDQIAAEVPFTPAGGLVSTNTQAAIVEAAGSGLSAPDQAKLDAIVFIDPLQYDGACTGCGPGGSDITVTGTLDIFDRVREAVTDCAEDGEIKYRCEILIPEGDFDVDTSLSLWGAPGDGVGNTGLNGVILRGAGHGVIGLTGAGGCATRINWTGASAPNWMLNIHGSKFSTVSDMCLNLDGGLDGANVALSGVALTSDAAAGEPSIGNLLERLTINSRTATRVTDGGGDSTCFVISPDGTTTRSDTDSQIDNNMLRDSWLECHNSVYAGQGPSGGMMFENVVTNYAFYGYELEDSDAQIRGGYANTWSTNSASVGTAEQIANKAMCDAAEAFIKIGSTSTSTTEQPPSSSIMAHRLEADCGGGLITVQGASGVRDSSTILAGVEWSFGDLVGTDAAIDYRHDGTLSVSGTIGRRSGRTAAVPININPPNELNYNLDVNHVHNPSIIELSVAAKARPQAEDQSQNVALDRDRDGLPDFVHLTGDFNGDETIDSEDIQAAFDALTDANPRVLVDGVFDNSYIGNVAIPWDTTNFVELSTGSTLECEPGARIIGPQVAFWVGRSTAARQIATVPGASNVTVRGCTIDNPELRAPVDLDVPLTSLFPGIYFDDCADCLAEGNSVLGSVHSAFFMVNGQGTKFINNYTYASGSIFNHEDNLGTLGSSEPAGEQSIDLTSALANCAVNDPIMIELDSGDWDLAWVTATGDPISIRRAAIGSGRNPGLSGPASSGNDIFCSEGSKHAFEMFANDHTVAANNVISGNTARLTGGTVAYIRGVSTDEDSVANSCEDDTRVDCWHENPEVSFNTGIDSLGEMVAIRGARNGIVTGNNGLRTGGILFLQSDDFCSSEFDDGGEGADTATQFECTTGMVVTENTVRDAAPNVGGSSVGGAFRINNGHEMLVFTGNMLDGTIGGHGYAITGNVRNSTVEVLGRWIDDKGLIDGLNAAGTSPITLPLTISGKLENVGIGTAPGSTIQAIDLLSLNTALDFEGFSVIGTAGNAVRVAPPAGTTKLPEFRNFVFDSTRSGYMGTTNEAGVSGLLQCDASTLNRWVIVTDASSASDCDQSSGTGSTETRCYCDGSALAQMTLVVDVDTISITAGTGETIEKGGFFNGKMINTPSNTRYMFTSYGPGSVTGTTLEGVAFLKGPGMLSAETIRGYREVTESLSNFTVRNLSFDASITTLRNLGVDTADYSGDSWVVTTDAPSGACTSGAVFQDIDATASGALQFCRNSTLVVLD